MPAPPPSPIPRRPLRTPEPLLMIPLADTSLHNATHSETSAPTRASTQCLPPSEGGEKDVKRQPVPSLTESHLRDIERAWRRAIEVEIMSAAEGECLAGAECVSVYDPWGDIEVSALHAEIRTELLGLPWTMTKPQSGPPLPQIRPGAHDTKQNSTNGAASGMPYPTAISRKDVRPGADYRQAHPSVMRGMAQAAPSASTCDLQRSDTTCSALTTSSFSSAPSSSSLETPRTPHRARDIARRLQGDMRDNLDYLYDTFALDTCGDDEDGDITIREGGVDTTRTGMTGTGLEDGQYAASVSPWQLVMPSPHFSKPYEGVQMDDEWVITTPLRKGRGLRRVDTLGSLRSG